MKRLALILLLAAVPAHAFAIISFALMPATPLVNFEAHGMGSGTLGTLSGYNSIATAGTNVAITQRMYERIKPLRLAFTTTAAGTGGGTYTYEAFDTTAAASMCVSGAVACTVGVSAASVDCVATGAASSAAGNDVTLRLNAAGCATSPTGTINLEYTEQLVDEGSDFLPRFLPYGQFGLDGGGTFFGFDSYQFDSISCYWRAAGIVSGGTDTMRVQLIQKSDAGVVCTCDLPGACSDAQFTEHTCHCGGVKYLVGTHAIGQGYAVQWSTATNCGTNPRGVTCAIPFRK